MAASARIPVARSTASHSGVPRRTSSADAKPVMRQRPIGRAARKESHPGLPGSGGRASRASWATGPPCGWARRGAARSEEHTSELQSQSNLVCRLLLEKKKKLQYIHTDTQVYVAAT